MPEPKAPDPDRFTRETLGAEIGQYLGDNPVLCGIFLTGIQLLDEQKFALLAETVWDMQAALRTLEPDQLRAALRQVETRAGRRAIIEAVVEHARKAPPADLAMLARITENVVVDHARTD
jgi:hypothetical protein